MNGNRVVHHPFGKFSVLNLSFDVGMEWLYPLTVIGREVIDRPIQNRSEEIEMFLDLIRAKARHAGYNQIRVVAEATGVYHELLFRVAIRKRMETALVDPGAVKRIREAIFRDRGKTDQRDPVAIADLASRNCLITHRQLPETYKAFYNKPVHYKNDRLNGEYKEWWGNGILNILAHYKNGKLDGEYKRWWGNSNLEEESYYRNGKLDGEYKEWNIETDNRFNPCFNGMRELNRFYDVN